jgi:peptidoglycan/LPS O-acetylase OafA/YrhL
VLLFQGRSIGPRIFRVHWLRFIPPILIIGLLCAQLSAPVSEIAIVPLSAFLILSLLESRSKMLSLAPIKWLGVVSYSLYMCHELVLWVITQIMHFILHDPQGWKAVLAYAAVVVFALIGAKITFVLLEKPSLEAVKRRKMFYSPVV